MVRAQGVAVKSRIIPELKCCSQDFTEDIETKELRSIQLNRKRTDVNTKTIGLHTRIPLYGGNTDPRRAFYSERLQFHQVKARQIAM